MNGHGSLNRIFRVVWNAVLREWQVASEHTRGKGKTKSTRGSSRGLAHLAAGSILVLCHAGALAELPTGGQVTAGSGQINTPSDGHMVINQNSNKMVIDWTSYSIGSGNSVQYIQPSADAIALNRVLGGDPSIIRGTISANGRVILLNPNGILFGPTSKVEVASLLASTRNITNENFMDGNYIFEGDSRNSIYSGGSIKAADGGFVALIAAKIENVGEINVRGGQVLMGAGRKVRLDLGGPARIEVDEAVVDAYIHNGGLIKAEGGTVIMTAKTAGELATLAINNDGIIEVTSLARGDGGTIRLLADGGTVTNSGTLNASAADGKGGYIEVTGKRVGILDGAVVDASGATGGGTVLLGGDYQGKNAAVSNAELTYIAQGATVRANAANQGDGGKVIVWSDDRTAFYGNIEAKGGAASGNGGFVEVSGKQYLDFQGTVNTSAANGHNGTLLLDPTNLTIGNVTTSSWITNSNGTFADFTTNINPDPAHDFSFLRVDVLQAALANNDITVLSACNTANCVGNITVKDAVTWSSGKTLTLDATGSIVINANITATGAAGTQGGSFVALAGLDVEVNANITTTGGAAVNGSAGLAGGNVTLQASNGQVWLANNAVINTGGSVAGAGSNSVAGGKAGNITLNGSSGITLNGGDLLAAGGAGGNGGADGVGGRITLTATTGDVSQNAGSQIVGNELLVSAGSGNVSLNTGSNAVNRLAGIANAGNFSYRNLVTAGLTVTDIGGVSGVSTGGSGSVNLAARNLQINSDISADTGSITLNANNGQQTGDFSGVVLAAGKNVTTQDGNITILGRGGNAATGEQSGVKILSGANVSAGGSGTVTVTGTGGTNDGNENHGVLIDGGMVQTTGSGSVIVNGTGGSGDGNENYGVVVGGTVKTAGTGTVYVTGTGGAGNGDENHGVVVDRGLIAATSTGAVNVTGTGGAGTGNDKYGVLIVGDGAADTGMITSAVGAIAVNATGGNGGDNNHAIVFENNGQIGDTSGNRNVTVTTNSGSGANSVAYSVDADGGYIGTGSGSLTLNGNVLSTNRLAAIAVRSTGNLTVQSVATSFSNPFSLSAFTGDFLFNGGGAGFNSIGNLTIGKTGNTAEIEIDQALSLANRTVTLIGGTTTLDANVTAGALVVTSSGDINLNKAITAATVNAQTSNGQVSLSDQITATTAVTLKTLQGNVDVNGEIAATGAAVTLSAAGNGTGGGTVSVNEAVTANSVTLTATNTASTATAFDGKANLNDVITAGTLTINATNDITQSAGGVSVNSATLISTKGDITLNSSSNQIANLTAIANTTDGDITVNNGSNALALNGNLTAKSVHLKAKSLNQTGGVITTDGLEVVTTAGDAILNKSNKVGTVAASVTGGDFTFRNDGVSTASTSVGAVGNTTGISATGAVVFNAVYDMDIAAAVNASSVTVNAGSRDIDLGTETSGTKLSLTDAEIDRITAASLTLKTAGKVTNSANVRAAGLAAMTIEAAQGIDNSGSGQLGFSSRENGSLTLKTTGQDAGMGIGSTNALVTVGASSLTLTSARDMNVDARTNAGASATLDKLYITSNSGAGAYNYGIASAASFSFARNSTVGWYQGTGSDLPVKGTYVLSLNNAANLDFNFVGNAPIQVNASNIQGSKFALQTNYGITVAGAITGTDQTISLNGGGASGNFVGVAVNANITTSTGSIVIEGEGGTGLNSGDWSSDQSNQYGVNIANGVTVRATGNNGSISITGTGGTSNGNGMNHDGVVIAGTVSGTGTNNYIEINGEGGGGYGSSSAPNTSDGIVFNGTGNIANANGVVALTGAAGSGYLSRAISQDGSGIITASGLSVVANSGGWVYLNNDNNVGTLAGDVRNGFAFDNGGHNLIIGTVNGYVGFSNTSASELGLYDIGTLTVAQNLEMASGKLKIAADTIAINSGKHIGSKTSDGREVDVWLTGQADYGNTSSRAIDIGTNNSSALGFTSNLLDNVYANELTLATTTTTTVTADTDFQYINKLKLSSGGAISNGGVSGANYILLSGVNNTGTVEFNGSSVGANGANPILVRGANSVIVNSGNAINVEAYTDDASRTDLINLRSVELTSTSGAAAGLDYRVLGAGLDYSATSDGSSYAVWANSKAVSGDGTIGNPYVFNPVNFSFTGNQSVAMTDNSDLKGGNFSAYATAGNLTVNDGVTITSAATTFRASGDITFAGSASVEASGAMTIRSDASGGTLTTGTGTLASDGNISIWADNVALGTGHLIANDGDGTVFIDTRADVTSSRGILLGGEDSSKLSLTQAELNSIQAAKLVVGRNSQTYATSGAITVASVDLTQTGANIAELDLKSYSGSVNQTGALKVDTLDISLTSGAITLTQATNSIRNFSASTRGDIYLVNTGALETGAISSSGGLINVSTTGNLTVDGAVNATATHTLAEAAGGAISLISTAGSLVVDANITSNGASSSGSGSRSGGSIVLKGQDVSVVDASIIANGTGGGNSTSAGGAAGSVSIESTSAGGNVTLTDTTITLNAGSGGYASTGGAGGVAGTLTVTAAAGGNIALSDSAINLNGASGGGTAGNGRAAGTMTLNTSGSGKITTANTTINVNGGYGSGTGSGGNAGTVTANGSNIALNDTTVNLEGGNGGGTGTGGAGGGGGTLNLNAASNGTVTLSNATINLNGGDGNGTASNGGNAGLLNIATAANSKTILDGGAINLIGGAGAGTGSRGFGSDLTFNNNVLLTSLERSSGVRTTTINVGGEDVRFAAAVDGGVDFSNNLTINSSRTVGNTTNYGNVTFDQAVGTTNAIGDLNLSSIQNVAVGTVNTPLALNSSGAVSLNVKGDATLGSVHAASLIVSNTDTTAHDIRLGAVTAGSVSVTNTKGTTTLNGNVATTGSNGININSKTLTTANGVGYSTTGGGNIVLATTDAMTLANTSAFNASGNIDLKSDGGITISGSSLTTNGGGIIFRSATVLASDVSINTTANNHPDGGNVSFKSTLDSDANAARALTVNAGTNGNVEFSGAVGATKALGAVTVASANDVTVSSAVNAASFTQQAGSGTTTFNGATALTGDFAFTGNVLNLKALTAQTVSIVNAGLLTTSGAITATVNGFTQSGAGAVQLGGNITTTGKDIQIAGVTTINGNVTLSTGTTGNGDIKFTKTIDNAASANSGSLTLTAGDGEIVFGDNVGATTAVGSLTINTSKDVTLPVIVKANSLQTNAGGSTILQNGAVVTTNAGQSYGDAVKLNGDVTLSSTNSGQIQFANAVDGAHALAVNTAGNTIFGGMVGGTTALSSLTTDAGGTVTFSGGGVKTTGDQAYGENAVLGANATFTSTGGGDVTFGGTVNGGYAMTVATDGDTVFNGAVGNTNALSSVTVANVAGKSLVNGGLIRTTGNQTYNSGNMILADGTTTLQSTSVGTIALNGKVDADICTTASLEVLTQGATVFGGAIGTYRPLWDIYTDGAANVAGNTVTFQQGTVITLNDQTYGELAILGTNTSLKSLGQGTITFDGPIHAAQNGAQSLTVDTSGDIVFNGKVGESGSQLASLNTGASVDGAVKINGGGVSTTGAQLYTKDVVVGSAATLESSNNGNITFADTVDGSGALTVNTGGTTRFNGAVGGTTPLASLTTGGSGNVVLNGGVVRTTTTQKYNNAVTLAKNTVMSSSSVGSNGEISFARTLDGAYALAIDTSGETRFDGAVGGSAALASLVTDAGGTVKINGGLVRTTGEQKFNENVEVGANTTFTSNGPITFGGELDGPHDVTVRTPGVTTFGGAIGSNAPLKNLYGGTGAGSINIMGPSIALTGSLIFEEPVRVYGPTTVNVGVDALFYGDARIGKSFLDVTAGGRIQYGRPIDNIKNYLPTLFAVANQSAMPLIKPAEVQQPVSVALADKTSSRQLGLGNLQFVNLMPSAAEQGGTAGTQNVSESAVNQAVGQIANDESSRSLTYIVTVQGGVRLAEGATEEMK